MPPPVLPGSERSSNPRGLNPPARHLHHPHHPQQRHFIAAGGATGRHLDGGADGLYGDDDNFDFLRTILLDAGDGSAHAAHHHHHNNSALPSLGGAGAGYVPISTFAPISAAKSPAYAAAVTSAPQALHPVLASSSLAAAAAAAASGRRFSSSSAPGFGGSYSGGDASASTAGGAGSGSSGGGVLGAAGVAGYPHAGGGGARGGFHASEEEKLQAADDIAGCIWLAGDEIREVLLTRLWEVWGTAGADMTSMAAGSGSAGGGAAPSSSSKKGFNEVLMERLQATCKEVEAELKAAKGRGDVAAFCDPPQQHWRGMADLRDDILSRLEAFQRSIEEEARGLPVFSSIRRMNDLDEQQRQRAVSAAASAAAAAVGTPTRGTGVRGTAPPPSSGGRSRSDVKQGSDRALDGTNRVVKSELLMYGERDATTGGAGTDAGNPSTAAGGGGEPSNRGRRTSATNAPPAAGGTTKRKRKRSGNGRRCKHEGW